jgi:putative tryptophan/tyrosine transport system substrate-binding protein
MPNIHKTKKILILFFTVIIAALLVYYFFSFQKKSEKTYHIAILKTASHPALDLAERGFKKVVQEKLKNDVSFETKNANDSIAAMDIIADTFVFDPSIALFYAIATPALQAISQKEKYRPIVFSAVTDPSDLQLEKQHNACGVTDFIDADAQLSLITTLCPTTKTIAVPFNNAEINSVYAVSRIKAACKKRNITVIEVGVIQAADIVSALEQKATHVDLILTPTDNLVAISMPIIASFSQSHNIPLVVSDNTLLLQGAVASCGIDYFKLGKKAGNIAISILEQKQTPKKIGYQNSPLSPLFVNKKIFEFFQDTLVFEPKTMKMVE